MMERGFTIESFGSMTQVRAAFELFELQIAYLVNLIDHWEPRHREVGKIKILFLESLQCVHQDDIEMLKVKLRRIDSLFLRASGFGNFPILVPSGAEP